MKITNINGKNLHIIRMISGISMKFSRKMLLIKNQGFILCLEDIFFKKTTGRGGQIT